MENILRGANKDHLAGLLMIVLGSLASAEGAQYDVGTLQRMGPGFFPTAVGALLALVGALIFVLAFNSTKLVSSGKRPIDWRGPICICGGIALFLILATYSGFLPATFAIVFVSALGDRQNSVANALMLAAAICLICVVVFWWGLNLQFDLFGAS